MFHHYLWLYSKVIQNLSIRIKYFQYKVFNRIVFLNDILFKLKITNTECCTFCYNVKETIEHFFYFCNFSRNIWSKIETWISSPMFTLKFTPQNILFGYKEKRNDALNCIIILHLWYEWEKKRFYFEMEYVETFVWIMYVIWLL